MSPRASRAGLALAAAAMAACAAGDASVRQHVPSGDVPRMSAAAVHLPDVEMINGFAFSGDRLVILDGMAARVRTYTASGEEWHPAGDFGRKGEGPGELQLPSGVALIGDDVLVTDIGHLRRFTSDGALLHEIPLTTGCSLLRPATFVAGERILIAGNCFQGGAGSDSLLVKVYELAPDSSFREAGSDVLFTRDGRVGSFLTSSAVITDSGEGAAFAAGTTGCFFLIPPSAGQAPQRSCVAGPAYKARPSPEDARSLEQRRRARPELASALQWPNQLPWLAGIVFTSTGPVVIRQWSSDSMSFQTQDGQDVLVAEWRSFLGCRGGACLWASVKENGWHMRLLRADSLLKRRS